MITLPARFWAKAVELPNGCWEWTAAIQTGGYGSWRCQGEAETLAHRWSYGDMIGEIPRGLSLDHLCHDIKTCAGGSTCRHRRCINAYHLDPVPLLVNYQRGHKGQGQSLITHCPHGHEYAGDNLYINPRGQRQCKACLSFYKRGMRLAVRVERALHLAALKQEALQEVAA